MTNPETPTVERFDLEIATTGYTSDHSMKRSDDGEWVRHADYFTLHAEHQRLREENARLRVDLRAPQSERD